MALCRLARIRKVADQQEQTRKDKKLKREALKRKCIVMIRNGTAWNGDDWPRKRRA